MGRVIAREHGALLEIGQHAGAQPLGERDARLPVSRLARSAPEHDQRPLRARQQRHRLIDRLLGRARRRRRLEARHVGPFGLLVEPRFLEAGVEADIDRRGRRRAGGQIGPRHRFHQRLRRGRLVVPFDDGADEGALIARGVDPVDPGTALFGIHRPGGAQHHHGHPVAPGVEQTHHAVQQPDIAVQHATHGLAGRLGIAVRDRDRMVLMQAQQDAGIFIAQMIDQAVMQPAIARARVEAEIADAAAAQHLRRDVAAPGDLVVGLSFRLVQQHLHPLRPTRIRALQSRSRGRRRIQYVSARGATARAAQAPRHAYNFESRSGLVFRDVGPLTPSPRGGEGGMRGLGRCDTESS